MRIEVRLRPRRRAHRCADQPHHQRHHRAAVQAGRFLRRHQCRPRPDASASSTANRFPQPDRAWKPSGTAAVPWPVLICRWPGVRRAASSRCSAAARGAGSPGSVGGGIAWWITSQLLFAAAQASSVCSCSVLLFGLAAAWAAGRGGGRRVPRHRPWRFRRRLRRRWIRGRRRFRRRRWRRFRRRRRVGALVVSPWRCMRTLRHLFATRLGTRRRFPTPGAGIASKPPSRAAETRTQRRDPLRDRDRARSARDLRPG